jgi:hypothetical protein
MLVRALSIILGLLFLVAGLAKVFVVDAFALTVAAIAHITASAGFILAAAVICMEAVGAIALISNYRVRMVSLAFCIVVGVFIWILSTAILQGKEIDCNCFGVLGIALSNRYELLLDVVLFNAFGVLAFLSPGKTASVQSNPGSPMRVSTIILLVVVVVLEGLLVLPLLANRGNGGREDLGAAIQWAERADSAFASFSGGNRALLVIRFSDMSCPLCADDLFEFVDSLQSPIAGVDHQVVAVFENEPLLRGDSLEHVNRWIAANGFRLPVLVAPDSVAERIHLDKSLVAVINVNDRVLLSERFPMGLAKRLTAVGLVRL